jgi:hypothetical protein
VIEKTSQGFPDDAAKAPSTSKYLSSRRRRAWNEGKCLSVSACSVEGVDDGRATYSWRAASGDSKRGNSSGVNACETMSKMILDSMEGKRAGKDLPPNSVIAPEPVKGGTTGGGDSGGT